jgi:hypothetical protein
MSAQYDQLIYDTAIKNGFTPTAAKLVVAQARYESSDYDSAVFKNNLNTSGMKFVGQPLATRGTLAPFSERSSGCQAVSRGQVGGQGASPCRDSDHYAKFKSVADSAKDKIERNFNITRKGVTPEQLKNAQTPEEFARLLKVRGYYGGEESSYVGGLKAKLLRVQVVEFVSKNKNVLLLVIGAAILGGAYYYYKKK